MPDEMPPAPPGAWYGPIMGMAQSSLEVKKQSKALRKSGGAVLKIEVRDLGGLADWLIDEGRLRAWDDQNRDEIEKAVALLLREAATRRPNRDVDCGSSCSHVVSPTDPDH